MSLTKSLIAEIKHESAGTKRMIQAVPAESFEWRPHAKSMKLKTLATHIVGLADWPELIAKMDELDLAGDTLKNIDVKTNDDLVAELEQRTQKSIEALQSFNDEDLNEIWTLKAGDRLILQLPKAVAIRSMALNHLYHHRAQLSVYLRLLDIPIAGLYGPSADEKA